jgi:hypothetical protein
MKETGKSIDQIYREQGALSYLPHNLLVGDIETIEQYYARNYAKNDKRWDNW